MLVKICGVRRAEHALAAAAAGADMLGLVFAPSRRQLSVAEAVALAAAVRAAPGPRPLLVGLFVNAAPAELLAVAEAVGLDLVQLSGDEPPAHAQAIPLPILKAVRMDGSPAEQGWLALARQHAAAPGPLGRVTLLVDAHVPGAYGGTGVVADWTRAAALARDTPLLLAGGLNPENVAAAIRAVRPLGVDVSSGVETAGVKDSVKIEAFLGSARAAQ